MYLFMQTYVFCGATVAEILVGHIEVISNSLASTAPKVLLVVPNFKAKYRNVSLQARPWVPVLLTFPCRS